MTLVTTSITFPEELLEEIDELAATKFTNRSAMFRRIYLEWKKQAANLAAVEEIFQQNGIAPSKAETPNA